MSRRRANTIGVSLFPFLAVLLCTMGALIVLLVLITEQAKKQAHASTAPPAQPPEPEHVELKPIKPAQLLVPGHEPSDEPAEEFDPEVELELIEWRIQHIKTQEEMTLGDIQEEKARLSHIEDHIRKLRKQLAELQGAIARLENLAGSKTSRQSQVQQQVEQLRGILARKQQELEAARQKAAQEKVSYAIVPFDGRNQTRRRPIYLECRNDAIIVQPEGVRIPASDFEGRLGPSNPLAAALRAINEYLLEQGLQSGGKTGKPYPLLLVRPDGILGYYAARAALTGTETEFGYELIEEDWELEFGPPDPSVAQVAREAIAEARKRRKQLAVMAPRLYGGGTAAGPQRYRANPTGGGIIVDGPAGESPGTGGGRDGSGSQHSGGSQAPGGSGTGAPGGSASGPRFGSLEGGHPNQRSGSGAGDPGNATSDSGGFQASSVGPRYSSPQGTSTQPNPGRPGQQQAAAGSGSGSNSAGGTPGASGNGGGPGGNASVGVGGSSFGSGSAGQFQPGESNWATRQPPRASFAVQREIRVEVHPDRLVFQPDGKELFFQQGTASVLAPLAAGVWKRVDDWGIAGRGMHWEPSIVFDVKQQGGGRFRELKQLLEGSGLDYRAGEPGLE